MRLKRMVSLLGVLLVMLLAYAGSYVPGLLFAERERRLFAECGIMEMEETVLPWEEDQPAGDADAQSRLETERIEQVIRTWKESDREFLHEPVEGQLSMEEAFEAGQEWINAMSGAGCYPLDYAGSKAGSAYGDHASAVLVATIGSEGENQPRESYYSCWNVIFYNEDTKVRLWINAVTGLVWEAELIMYAQEWNLPEDFAYDSLVKFLELSGVENAAAGFAENRLGAVLYLEGTSICGEMEREDAEWIYVWSEDDGTKRERRCMRISYRLGVIG